MEAPRPEPIPFEIGMDRFRQPLWTIDKIDSWYGTSFLRDPRQLEAQYQIFAGRYPNTDAGAVGQSANRFVLELFFQERDLVASRHAAAQMGMSLESFVRVLDRAAEEQLIHRPTVEPYPGVVTRNFVRSFHKSFEELRHSIFGSHTSYVERLHANISARLELPNLLLYCETSKMLQDDPLVPAYNLDIITDEPIGICYQVHLENGKPGSLSPDTCSWKTFVAKQEQLGDLAMGRTIDRMGERYSLLRRELGY